MVRLIRFLWKIFILASVFGIGYIIGREHSFEEDEEWDLDEEEKESSEVKPSETKDTSSNLKTVTFEYVDDKASSVSVVGDFNDWNKDKNPLRLENGVWKAEIALPVGRHEYKFVVNNTDWIVDPKATETVPDKYGGKSSVINVA